MADAKGHEHGVDGRFTAKGAGAALGNHLKKLGFKHDSYREGDGGHEYVYHGKVDHETLHGHLLKLDKSAKSSNGALRGTHGGFRYSIHKHPRGIRVRIQSPGKARVVDDTASVRDTMATAVKSQLEAKDAKGHGSEKRSAASVGSEIGKHLAAAGYKRAEYEKQGKDHAYWYSHPSGGHSPDKLHAHMKKLDKGARKNEYGHFGSLGGQTYEINHQGNGSVHVRVHGSQASRMGIDPGSESTKDRPLKPRESNCLEDKDAKGHGSNKRGASSGTKSLVHSVLSNQLKKAVAAIPKAGSEETARAQKASERTNKDTSDRAHQAAAKAHAHAANVYRKLGSKYAKQLAYHEAAHAFHAKKGKGIWDPKDKMPTMESTRDQPLTATKSNCLEDKDAKGHGSNKRGVERMQGGYSYEKKAIAAVKDHPHFSEFIDPSKPIAWAGKTSVWQKKDAAHTREEVLQHIAGLKKKAAKLGYVERKRGTGTMHHESGSKVSFVPAVSSRKGKFGLSTQVTFHVPSAPKPTQESVNTETKKSSANCLESAFTKPDRIDRETGLVKRIKILGYTSVNHARYTRSALESAIALYDGAPVYLDHPDRENPGKDRSLKDKIGVILNPVLEGDGSKETDGLYGDFQALLWNPEIKSGWIFDAMESTPDELGFSHNTVTEQVPDGNGGIIHKSIKRVRSVDLVANPATTRGVFESENPMDSTAAMVGGTADDMQDDAAVGGGDPLSLIMDSFCEQAKSIFDSEDDDGAKIKKFKDLVKKSSKIKDILSDDEEEEPADEADDETEESYESEDDKPDDKPKGDLESVNDTKLLQAENRLLKAGIKEPSKTQIKVLASVLESKEESDELIKGWCPPAPPVKKKEEATAKPKSTSALESGNDGTKKGEETKAPTPSFIALAHRPY